MTENKSASKRKDVSSTHKNMPSGSFWSLQPPSVPEAEYGLVASVLRSSEKMDLINLTEDDFHDPALRDIWTAIRSLHNSSKKVDSPAVAVALKEAGSQYGSIEIARVLDHPPTYERQAAAKVREYSLRRQLMSAAASAATAAADPTEEFPRLVDPLARFVDRAISEREQESLEIQDVMKSVLDDAMHGIRVRPIQTPFSQLNHLTGGMFPGELVVLAGRPGTGKTALALNIAVNSMYSGQKVGMFSLEMKAKALVQRIAAATQGLDAQAFRHGKYSQSDVQALKRFALAIGSKTKEHGDLFHIHDTTPIDVDFIRAECRKWKRKGSLDLVVIDYLQLIQPFYRRESTREREVAEITRAMKSLALEVEVPVLLLSQLNRAVESRNNKKPVLSDLRESGSIEQDADQVWFLSPWNVSESEKDIISVNLFVEKSRNSATGRVPLEYHRSRLRFAEESA